MKALKILLIAVTAICIALGIWCQTSTKLRADAKAEVITSVSASNKESILLPAKAVTPSNTPKKVESKSITGSTSSEAKSYGKGDYYLAKYLPAATVKQVILVRQSTTTISEAKLHLLEKGTDGDWQERLNCIAYLGRNGINKVKEGDKRTPSGDYGFSMAFGIKDNPGSLIKYTKLTDTMYLCGDKEYYNQFIDTSIVKHTCTDASEHLIKYSPTYNYALNIAYNKECVYGKGSAIFLHCKGNYNYTLGCIAVSEADMISILRTVESNARICIY